MTRVKDSRSRLATDPLRNFRFKVLINHKTQSGYKMTELGFMQAAGLNVETSVITYRQGGYNTTQQKMPGQSEFTPITLARGAMVGKPHSIEWMQEIFSIIQGAGSYAPQTAEHDFRTTMSILVMAHPWTTAEVPVKMRFRVYNAWPVSMSYSDLDAGGNAVLMEQMVIQHEGWKASYAADAYASVAPGITPKA